MNAYHWLAAASLVAMPAAGAAESIVFQCSTTSGEQSQWMLGNGEVRWNYGEGWSDNRCLAGDSCYFDEHGIYMGQSAAKPGEGDAWEIMYSPLDGELIYEEDAGGTTTFCHAA